MIPTVNLGDGVSMPMVGFGTWQLRGRRAYHAIRYALEVGYRHIDTATKYRNEADVGRAVRDSGLARDEVFITTKLHPKNAGRERATLEASLRALGTPYVDLWLVHWPQGSLVPVWEAFTALRSDGLCRAIGVSNFSVAQVDEITQATGEKPAANQVAWSPFQHDERVLSAFGSRGVVVEGYSPLKGTRLDEPVLTSVAAAQAPRARDPGHTEVRAPRPHRSEHSHNRLLAHPGGTRAHRPAVGGSASSGRRRLASSSH
jgi:2,5-diketo-D-gluconate reductase A